MEDDECTCDSCNRLRAEDNIRDVASSMARDLLLHGNAFAEVTPTGRLRSATNDMLEAAGFVRYDLERLDGTVQRVAVVTGVDYATVELRVLAAMSEGNVIVLDSVPAGGRLSENDALTEHLFGSPGPEFVREITFKEPKTIGDDVVRFVPDRQRDQPWRGPNGKPRRK